jgi:hypothetical protein
MEESELFFNRLIYGYKVEYVSANGDQFFHIFSGVEFANSEIGLQHGEHWAKLFKSAPGDLYLRQDRSNQHYICCVNCLSEVSPSERNIISQFVKHNKAHRDKYPTIPLWDFFRAVDLYAGL